MNSPTNTAKNAPLPIVSEEVAAEITSAFHNLYRLLAGYSSTAPLTMSVESTGRDEWERVAARGLSALKARQVYIQEQAVAQFRQGVRDAIAPHIDTAREDKAEYDSLSPTLKARVGAFQTHILVPLSDVSEVFPQGTQIPAQVKMLTDMGYKVSKSTAGAYSLRVELPASITGVTPASK